MKALVIGGAGFIGSHIVEQLEGMGADVRIYDDYSRGSFGDKDTSYGDICTPETLRKAMEGREIVFHLAALWLLECYMHPADAFRVNVEGAFNVLQACVDTGIKRLVYSSSASVYGDRVQYMNENHPYNNQTFYGATKIAGEHMLQAYHHRYGLNGVALRYMNVYGPRQDYRSTYTSVIMKTLDSIRQGVSPVVYGTGEQTYDFIYVTDVARANICAAESDVDFGFYNVATGIGTPIKTLIELILHIKKSELPIVYKNEDTPTFVKDRIGCPEKAKRDLGFQYEINLKEGLKKLIEWHDTISETVDHGRDEERGR